MRLLGLVVIFFFAFACAPALPELPADIPYETVTDYEAIGGETSDTDNRCDPTLFWYDGVCRTSDLIVATTGGYDAPFSGKVLRVPEEDLTRLAVVAFPEPVGGPTGTDLSLSVSYDRFMVIGRDGADTVWVYGADGRYRVTLRSPTTDYLNFMDAVWDGTRYIVSANEATVLFLFDEQGATIGTVDLTVQMPEEGIPPSPAAILLDNGILLIALQMLGPDWISRGGSLARWKTAAEWHNPIDLPVANPVGPLVMNRALSTRHLFVSCVGSYQARNGGLVRVDLFGADATTILSETTDSLSPLNVKVGPLAVTNDGDIYFTAFDADWKGHLQVLRRDGTVQRVVSAINAFAAVPLDYSPHTGRLYFFTQQTEGDSVTSYLNAFDTRRETIEETIEIPGAPAALRVWIREPLSSTHERR